MTQPAQVDPSRAPTLPAPAMVSPPRVAPFTFGDPHIAFHDSDIDASLYDAIANGDFRVVRTSSGRFYAMLTIDTRLGRISAAVHLDPHQVDATTRVTSGQALPQIEGVCRLAEEVATRLETAAQVQGVTPLELDAARLVVCAQFGDQRAAEQLAEYGMRAAAGDKDAIRFMRAILDGQAFARAVLGTSTPGGGTLFDDLARAVPHAVGAAVGDTLGTNTKLDVGGSISTPNGAASFVLQPDGEAVLKANHENRVYWRSGTKGKPSARVWMAPDGNLRVEDQAGKTLWDNGAHGHKDAFARIESDGNLVVWDGTNHMIWDAGANLQHPNPIPGGHGSAHTDFGGPDIGHDLEHFGNDLVNDVKKFGPMILSDVQGLVSMIPGIGTGISAAIGLAEALLEGGSAIEIAIRTAYAAIPIPPGVRNVTDPIVDAALNFAKNPHDFTDVAIQTVRDRVPDGIPREVFDTLVNIIVKKQPVLKVVGGLAEHIISSQTDGIVSTLAKALPNLSGPMQATLAQLPPPGTVFASIHTLAPHLQINPAQIPDLLHTAQMQAPALAMDPAIAAQLAQHAQARVQEQYKQRLGLHALQQQHVAPRVAPPLAAGDIAHLGIETDPTGQQHRAIASPALAHLVPTIRL
jgi:hypothetical protein